MNLKPFKNLLSGSALAAPALGITAFLSISAPSYAVGFTATYDFNINTRNGVLSAPVATLTPIVDLGLGPSSLPLVSLGAQSVPGPNRRLFFNPLSTTGTLGFSITPIGPNTSFNFNGGSLSFLANRSSPAGNNVNLNLTVFDGLNNLIFTSPTTAFLDAQNTVFPVNFALSGFTSSSTTTFTITASYPSSQPVNLEFDNIVLSAQAVPYEFETAAGVLLFGGYFVGKRYLKAKMKSKG